MFSLSDINYLTVCLLRTILAEIKCRGAQKEMQLLLTLRHYLDLYIGLSMVSIMLPGLQFNFVDDTVCGLIEIERFYCAIIISEHIWKTFTSNLYSAFRNNVPNSIQTSKTWTKTMVVSNKSCLAAYYLLPVFPNKSEIIKLLLTW